METSNKLCYWFLFYKDQLLLQKENDTYTIPYGENPPVPVSRHRGWYTYHSLSEATVGLYKKGTNNRVYLKFPC